MKALSSVGIGEGVAAFKHVGDDLLLENVELVLVGDAELGIEIDLGEVAAQEHLTERVDGHDRCARQ